MLMLSKQRAVVQESTVADLAVVRRELAEIQAQARRPPTQDYEARSQSPDATARLSQMDASGTAPSTLRGTRGIPKSQVLNLNCDTLQLEGTPACQVVMLAV